MSKHGMRAAVGEDMHMASIAFLVRPGDFYYSLTRSQVCQAGKAAMRVPIFFYCTVYW